MRLTKYTHACVRLDDGDRKLVIDPGVWSEPESLDDVSDVLVTHEHADHLDVDKLAKLLESTPGSKVYTHADVAAQLDQLGSAVVTVGVGDSFQAGGFTVRAVGGAHAEIYDGLPGCANLGYVVDTTGGSVYHPGDSCFVPSESVDTLLVPTSAPWLKLREAIDLVRAVAPRRAYSIHDALLNELAEQLVDRWLAMKGETEYGRLQPGESTELSGSRMP